MIDPQALMGGGAPQGGGAPPQTIQLPGGGGKPDSAPPQTDGDPVDMLREALAKVRGAAVSQQDDELQAKIEKVGTDLANIIAQQQADQDAMMGTTPAHKGLRRMTQQAQAGGGGGGAY